MRSFYHKGITNVPKENYVDLDSMMKSVHVNQNIICVHLNNGEETQVLKSLGNLTFSVSMIEIFYVNLLKM